MVAHAEPELIPSVNQAWLTVTQNVLNYGCTCAPRGAPITELLGAQTCIDMNKPVLTVKSRDLGYKFLFAEAWWILTGDNRVSTIEKYANIKRFSDDGIRFQGAYGPMLMEQIRYVVETLEQDPDSRQAVATIWRPNPRSSKDVPCTVACQWFIRQGRLHYNHTMRSSDLWLGYPYDVFNFSCISNYIRLLLIERGVLDMPELKLGAMVFTAGSQHIYGRNNNCIEACLDDPEWLEYPPIFQKTQAPEKFIECLEYLKDDDSPILEKLQCL